METISYDSSCHNEFDSLWGVTGLCYICHNKLILQHKPDFLLRIKAAILNTHSLE